MINSINYITGGQLQRDIAKILSTLTTIFEVIIKMSTNLDDVQAGEDSLASAIGTLVTGFNTFTADENQTIQDLQAEIANLQANGADTTKIAAIVKEQQANLQELQTLGTTLGNLQTTTTAADPGPVAPTAPVSVPPVSTTPTSGSTGSDDSSTSTPAPVATSSAVKAEEPPINGTDSGDGSPAPGTLS